MEKEENTEFFNEFIKDNDTKLPEWMDYLLNADLTCLKKYASGDKSGGFNIADYIGQNPTDEQKQAFMDAFSAIGDENI